MVTFIRYVFTELLQVKTLSITPATTTATATMRTFSDGLTCQYF